MIFKKLQFRYLVASKGRTYVIVFKSCNWSLAVYLNNMPPFMCVQYIYLNCASRCIPQEDSKVQNEWEQCSCNPHKCQSCALAIFLMILQNVFFFFFFLSVLQF